MIIPKRFYLPHYITRNYTIKSKWNLWIYCKKDHKIPDWQIRQACQAVQVYLVNFKGKTVSDALSLSAGSVARGSDVSRIIEEMKRSIRLKHYSLSTE
jgi:hypothetical protein